MASIYLNGGYSDNTYTATSGSTRLNGTLTIRNGTLRVTNLAVSGNAVGGVAISNVTVTVPRIAWTTDQLADSRVDYGETTSYGSTVNSTNLTTSHSLVFTGLKPNTTYHFIVSSSTSVASAATADSTFTTPSFIAATIGDIGNAAIIEVSGNYDAINTSARQNIAQEYFKTHSDNVDFLVMLSTFNYAMPDSNAKGFYTQVKNDVTGINQAIFNYSPLFGSNGKLQGVIDMGNVASIVNNPLDPTFDGALTILSHEIMHRWGAYVTYKKPDNSISSDLLGKDGSHWSYLLDSSASVMYGSAWKDNGNGTFTAFGITNSYSYLDLYLMGMIDKTQVPPMLLISNPNPAIDKTQLPKAGVTISGTSTTVGIDDIIAVPGQGDRAPLSAQAQKSFRVGYVLLIHPGDPAGTYSATIEALRKAWAGKFAALTGTAGSILDIAPELSITLAPSLNGSTVTGPNVLVEGTFLNTTGNETGITVNTVPASVLGNHFIVNHILLQSGVNTIKVIATDTTGQTATTTATVTSVVGDYIRLITDTEVGLAPQTASLTILASFGVTNPTITSSGPATATISAGASALQYVASFPAEGIYTITISALGPGNKTYQDTVKVIVLSKIAHDRLFKAKWDGMKSAIIQGNPSAALNYFVPAAQGRYGTIFNSSTSNISTRLSEISNIEIYSVDEKTADGGVLRTEVNGVFSYPISFVKDENGLWKLMGF